MPRMQSRQARSACTRRFRGSAIGRPLEAAARGIHSFSDTMPGLARLMLLWIGILSLEHVGRWCFGGENGRFWVLMRLIFEAIAALWARK